MSIHKTDYVLINALDGSLVWNEHLLKQVGENCEI